MHTACDQHAGLAGQPRAGAHGQQGKALVAIHKLAIGLHIKAAAQAVYGAVYVVGIAAMAHLARAPRSPGMT